VGSRIGLVGFGTRAEKLPVAATGTHSPAS
jgi:hypothetical protein